MKTKAMTNEIGILDLTTAALKTLSVEHPKATKLVVYGGLSLIFGAKFIYELRTMG